jgi:hypothetical protein
MGIAMVVAASVALVAHAIPSEHRDTHHRPVADHGGRATPLPAPNLTDVPMTPGGPVELAEVPPLFLATGTPSLFEQRGHDFAELHQDRWDESFAGTDAGTHGGAPGFLMYHELLALDGVGLARHEAPAAAPSSAGLFARRHVDRPDPFGPLRASSRRDPFVPDGSPRLGMYMLRRPVGMTLPGPMTRGRWYEPGARDRVLGRPSGR